MEVICSGLNVVDLLVASPDDIAYGQKNECEKIIVQGGAPAGNAACALARLGHETAFLGYFGDDTLSQIAKTELLKHGVKDKCFVYKKLANPAIAIVQIDSRGERTVLYSMQEYLPFQSEDIDDSIFQNAKLLLVDGYDTAINIHLLKLAKKLGIESVLDLEKAEKAIMEEMISLSSQAILPLEAAQVFSAKTEPADCLLEIARITNAQVVITDGVNGAYTQYQGKMIHQAAYKVDIVDTTGCGDAFHAAYASALLQGLDIHQRLDYASYFAAQVALHFGGRTYFPGRDFMNKHLKTIEQ